MVCCLGYFTQNIISKFNQYFVSCSNRETNNFSCIDYTPLTPSHLVCTSVSYKLGQKETAPKTKHYSGDSQGVKPWPKTRDIKKKFTYKKTHTKITKVCSLLRCYGQWTVWWIMFPHYALSCSWEYLRTKVLKCQAWATFFKGLGKSSSLFCNSRTLCLNNNLPCILNLQNW